MIVLRRLDVHLKDILDSVSVIMSGTMYKVLYVVNVQVGIGSMFLKIVSKYC